MPNTRVTVAAIALTALTACSVPSVPDAAEQGRHSRTGGASPEVVAEQIRGQLDGHVVGYVALVGDTTVAAGPARRRGDTPEQPMSTDVMANTASVGKMFTTVVVLTALARHGLSVDSPILPFLPPDWARGPNIDTVTFRELLTHRSGFRHDSTRIFTSDTAAKEQVALGITLADKRQADYNNINFSIVRDLLPQLDPDPQRSADQLFVDRVRHDVFDPAGVRSAICTQPVEPMLYYPPPNASPAPGKTPPIGPAACSSGGWFMTPADMLRVLTALEHGDLLPSETKHAMNDGCLGWDACTASGHWKNGGYGDGSAAFETLFGTADNIPIVAVSNSPSPYPLDSVVTNALFSARQPR